MATGKVINVLDQIKTVRQMVWNVSVPSNYNTVTTNVEASFTSTVKASDVQLLGAWVDYIAPGGWLFPSCAMLSTTAEGYVKVSIFVRNYNSGALTGTFGLAFAYIEKN